jgi:hypothetical protein
MPTAVKRIMVGLLLDDKAHWLVLAAPAAQVKRFHAGKDDGTTGRRGLF